LSHPLESLSSHTLFDAAADASLLTDHTGQVILANPAAQQLLGYAENEIVGLAVEMLVPARYRTSHIQHRDDFASKPEKRPMGNGRELVALSRDGRELPVDISLSPLEAEGHPYILITIVDATLRRQTENALRTSEERLRLAKHAAGLGIFDRDLISGILHWDERSREFWGLEPEEDVTYEKFLEGIHPEDRAARQAAIDRALDPTGNGEYQAEFRVIRRIDGIERWLTTTGRVFFEAGHPVRLVGTMQDITERKATERRFRELRSEREALLGQQVAVQTASAIAHELNQPLAAISAYSEVALHALGSNTVSTETLSRALEGCVGQAQRAGQSLHELLNFLQKGELASEPADLSGIVHEALSIMQNDGFGGFQPALELERGLPPVLGNRIQVQKVLINLLRNGVEAMREANVPTSAITVKVQTTASRNMVQVTVQDSGPGLDVNTAKLIFEPFFTTKPGGIGLGLAISRSLIEANGGQLWVDPDAGPGATFHFTLPFAP
jgi:two-component system sensor kinase FixL